MNGTALTIRQAQDEHALSVERVERAFYHAAVGLLDPHRRAGGVGVEQPVGPHGIKALDTPDGEPMGENLSQSVEQCTGFRIRSPLRCEAGDGAIKIAGMISDVEADTNDDGVGGALQQDTCNLCAVDQYVIGPFDPRLPGA